jgi:hypothetical protein
MPSHFRQEILLLRREGGMKKEEGVVHSFQQTTI